LPHYEGPYLDLRVGRRKIEQGLELFQAVLDKRKIMDWRKELTDEEKRMHLVVEQAKGGTRYDKRAYTSSSTDLLKLLHNISAHAWNHCFDGEEDMYEWVNRKWL